MNDPLYDKTFFEKEGIDHVELYFDDCTAPSIDIVKKFIKICKKYDKGTIAVHCKSGIGRTGTLIAIWIMLNYDITARETIAYLRIVRPGCIIGLQQKFLEELYDTCKTNNHNLLEQLNNN